MKHLATYTAAALTSLAGITTAILLLASWCTDAIEDLERHADRCGH
ncbi:hypothetical protein QYN14_25720 [Rhodococcus ruber]|nr:hypothetical protein [Rhodococcus ruber]WKK11949.1 hypothetical protein QYN14_25305 [Rhodococcus ruber]WKK12032.1 hypothetical protein QYN14_25720 [Rhodococcus ruber]